MARLIQVLIPSSALLASVVAALWRRRRRATRLVEREKTVAIHAIRYYFRRFIRRQLAAEQSLRFYASQSLESVARYMTVPASNPVQLEVDFAYVPLLLGSGTGDQQSHHKLLEEPAGRFIVIGEPGSGKSSLIKRVFRDGCRQARSRPRSSQIPFMFELRETRHLVGSADDSLTGDDLFAWVCIQFERSRVFKGESTVDELKAGAGLLILLDGLDEVPASLSAKVFRAIIELSSRLSQESPKSTLVVTTRSQHYQSVVPRQLKEELTALSIQDFTDSDIYNFLTRWPFQGKRGREVTRIYSRIRRLPSISEMCSNPLALAMYVARDQQTTGTDMPEVRTEFYKDLVDELIVRRRQRSDQAEGGRARVRRSRQSLLGAACLLHLLDADSTPNSVSKTVFETVAGNVVPRVPAEILENELIELANTTGLFGPERSGESYRFLHLTICEFLAATEIVERGAEAWSEIVEFMTTGSADQNMQRTARMSEVVAFVAGLAGRSLREQVLVDLNSLSDSATLLLKVALETQAYDDAQFAQSIERSVEELLQEIEESGVTYNYERISLVAAVLRDAESGFGEHADSPCLHSSATKPGPTPPLPSAATFLSEILDRSPTKDASLSLVTRSDPELAIEVVHEGDDLDGYKRVAREAHDIGVLAAIIHLGLIRRERAGHWTNALFFASMHNRGVALALSSVRLSDLELGAGAKSKWTVYWPMRDSLLAAVVSKVTNSQLGPGVGDIKLDHMSKALKAISLPRSEFSGSFDRSALLKPFFGRLRWPVLAWFVLASVLWLRFGPDNLPVGFFASLSVGILFDSLTSSLLRVSRQRKTARRLGVSTSQYLALNDDFELGSSAGGAVEEYRKLIGRHEQSIASLSSIRDALSNWDAQLREIDNGLTIKFASVGFADTLRRSHDLMARFHVDDELVAMNRIRELGLLRYFVTERRLTRRLVLDSALNIAVDNELLAPEVEALRGILRQDIGGRTRRLLLGVPRADVQLLLIRHQLFADPEFA